MSKIPPGLLVLGLLVVGGIGFGGYEYVSRGTTTTAVTAPGALVSVAGKGESVVAGKDAVEVVFKGLTAAQQVTFADLKDQLARRQWKDANETTYEVMLKLAGPKSLLAGMTDASELANLTTEDLKAIDALWASASHNKFGFTTQEIVLHGKANHDWHVLYHKLGWDEIKMQYGATDRRWHFAPGGEPDWDDLHTGELPTAERQYNFKVSLDNRLAAAGITGAQ
jgi:hypothetical protein